MDYERLDIYMFEHGYAESRTKAREMILSGGVSVNGKIVSKPSGSVPENADIRIIVRPKYVGRAGYKLETAVEGFDIKLEGLVCLDVGASVGGFTDLMLQNGAKKVYALDVGENQLHESLKSDSRVVSIEKQDIRTAVLPEKVDFIAADVSFISLKMIVPKFAGFLKDTGSFVVLIKPQFEAGKRFMKNGVLKDERLIEKIVWDIRQFIVRQGYEDIGVLPSKLNEKGKNREYAAYYKKTGGYGTSI